MKMESMYFVNKLLYLLAHMKVRKQKAAEQLIFVHDRLDSFEVAY